MKPAKFTHRLHPPTDNRSDAMASGETVIDIDSLSEAELDQLYGTPGEVLLERMGTFDFAPGAVDQMMAAIEEAFERAPEGGE